MHSALRLALILVTSGCATFNISVGRDTTRNNTRQEVAGTTLACAGDSQRAALYALLVSAGAGAASGLLASAATGSALTRPAEASGLAVASVAASIVSLAANVAAWAFLGRSVAYTERAGLVLAGLSTEGCNESGDLPRSPLPEAEPAVRRSAPAPVQRVPVEVQAIGKCTAAEASEMKRSGLSDSAIERACAP